MSYRPREHAPKRVYHTRRDDDLDLLTITDIIVVEIGEGNAGD